MAGLPQSSADFTPSWLKFNNIKQCAKKVTKENSHKQAVFRNKADSQSCSTTEVRCNNHITSTEDVTWPQLAGLNVTETGNVCHQSGWQTSRNLQSLTCSTTSTSKNISSVVNASTVPSSKDTDFPTLGKSQQRDVLSKHPHNVWNKPLVLRSSDNGRSKSTNKSTASKTACDCSSIYRSLVPKTSSANNKPPYRRTFSVPTVGSRYKSNEFNVVSSAVSTLQEAKEKDNHIISQASTEDFSSFPYMKRHKKGKNVFLKELRQTDKLHKQCFENKFIMKNSELRSRNGNNQKNLNSKSEEIPTHEFIFVGVNDREKNDVEMCENNTEKDWWEEVDNSVSDEDGTPSNPPLSSSLEAEHRLLRQMGWTDCDDGADGDTAGSDESPLTDAEIREFFLNYKKKGLLSVPSPTHRETAFKDALSAWLLSGPPVMRRPLQTNKGPKITSLHPLSPDSSASSDYSNTSYVGMESE